MIGQFFDIIIVASSDKSGYNDPSKYKRWKLFWATLNLVVFYPAVTSEDVEEYETLSH